MEAFEGHHSRHVLPPPFPGGGKQWIHAGDSVEIVGGFPVLESGEFPFRKKGAKATRNGNQNLVRVSFSLILSN